MVVRIVAHRLSVAGQLFNLTDPAAETVAGHFTAWAPAVLRWGADDGLEPLEPATLSVTVTVPVGARLPSFGDRVELDGRILTAGNDVVFHLFTGRVDTAERDYRTLTLPDRTRVKVHQITLEAADDTAQLRRIRLSDEPWPAESSADRQNRIAELVADQVTLADDVFTINGQSFPVAPRDVDSFSALEALELLAAATPQRIEARRDGIGASSEPLYGAVLELPTVGEPWIDRSPTTVPNLDARVLTDGPRTLDTRSVITHVEMTYRAYEPDDDGDLELTDRTLSVRDRDAALTYGENKWRLETDFVDTRTTPELPAWPEQSPESMLLPRLRRIQDARRREFWAMPEVEVLLDSPVWDEFPPSRQNGLVQLLAEGVRNGALLGIRGAPEDVDPYSRIAAGELELAADPALARLIFQLEPETFAAPRSLAYADLTLETDQLSRFSALTFDDLATVGRTQRTGA